MDYSTPVRVEVSPAEMAEMAARRRRAKITAEEANEARREIGVNKTLQEIFLTGVDVTLAGLPVKHWLPSPKAR